PGQGSGGHRAGDRPGARAGLSDERHPVAGRQSGGHQRDGPPHPPGARQSLTLMISFALGTITTIAGTGEPGCSGDGGPALKACLNEPKSITIAGRALYIADSENHRIRKVDLTTGLITTVAGEGTGGAPAPAASSAPATSITDELDPLADPVKVKDEKVVQLADQSGTVRFLVGSAEKGRFAGDGGPAVEATLNFPSAVVADRH